MEYKIVRMPIFNSRQAAEAEETLDAYAEQGYRIVNCGLTGDGLSVWAIMEKEVPNDPCDNQSLGHDRQGGCRGAGDPDGGCGG